MVGKYRKQRRHRTIAIRAPRVGEAHHGRIHQHQQVVVIARGGDLREPEQLVEPSVAQGPTVSIEHDDPPAYAARDHVQVGEGHRTSDVLDALVGEHRVEA